MAKLSIEDQIIQFYAGESGDWVIEKGKVKECRFLKQAVARIHQLQDELRHQRRMLKDDVSFWREKHEVEFERREEAENAYEEMGHSLIEFRDAISKLSKLLNEKVDF